MIPNKFMETFLQKRRFSKALPYIVGHVLDFGGNRGELENHLKHSASYTCINDENIPDKKYDTVVALAVIEHLPVNRVYKVLQKFRKTNGQVVITTPSKQSKPILEFMAWLGITDRENIREHKHYWNRKELFDLAKSTGFSVMRYKRFQFGLNQLFIIK